MSWNAYVDSLIGQCESHCDKATILGKTDGSDWVSPSANVMQLENNERSPLVALAADNITEAQERGLRFEGVKYNFIRKTEDNFYIFKKGSQGVAVGTSQTAIIIAHCKENGGQMGKILPGMNNTVTYLKGSNY